MDGWLDISANWKIWAVSIICCEQKKKSIIYTGTMNNEHWTYEIPLVVLGHLIPFHTQISRICGSLSSFNTINDFPAENSAELMVVILSHVHVCMRVHVCSYVSNLFAHITLWSKCLITLLFVLHCSLLVQHLHWYERWRPQKSHIDIGVFFGTRPERS